MTNVTKLTPAHGFGVRGIHTHLTPPAFQGILFGLVLSAAVWGMVGVGITIL